MKEHIPQGHYTHFPAINTAIVGFGLSGRVFHAPLIAFHKGFSLHTVMTSGKEAGQLYPGVRIAASFHQVIQDSAVELVVLCSPHQLHAQQAIDAMKAGKDVVIEKPVALNSKELRKVIKVSHETGRSFFPFHNRRWDGDFLTVKHLFREGYLGDIVEFESRFDRFSPEVNRAEWRYTDERNGGTLFDLGPHLVDQAIHLFGHPAAVHALLFQQRKGSQTNDAFDLRLLYKNTVVSLKAGIFIPMPGPRFQVHGKKGSYIKYGLDMQESRLKEGKLPNSSGFGADLVKNHGMVQSEMLDGGSKIKFPTFDGNYLQFYEEVYAALRLKKPAPVSAIDAIAGLRVLEIALESHKQGKVMQFTMD